MLSEESKKKKAEYDIEYRKKNMKRIILDLQLPFYENLKSEADKNNESVSAYIKKAVIDRIERDNPSL